MIADQVGAPTGAELADTTALALRSVLADPGKARLYHVVASGEATWHSYARFVIGNAQRAGAALKMGVDQVEPVPTCAFPTPALRPRNSRLDTSSFHQAFGLTLPHWQQGVSRMREEILCQTP